MNLINEKILISKFIHPSKIIKFNLVYTTKDSFDCKYFHDYCDDISPIIIVIYDNWGENLEVILREVSDNHLV